MKRATLLSCAVILFTAAAASADLPPPPDLKAVDPRVRFDGVEKHADYAFVLRYQSGAGNPFAAPVTTVVLKNAETTLTLKMGRRTVNMHLLALDRKEFDKRRADDGSLKWLTDKTDGVMRANIK